MAIFGSGTQTVHDERTDLRPEDGDHERFSHYVPKDTLTEAMVMGTPCVALCGKVWTPSRDPQRFPVCPECKEIWESMSEGGDDQGNDKGKGGSGRGGFFGRGGKGGSGQDA